MVDPIGKARKKDRFYRCSMCGLEWRPEKEHQDCPRCTNKQAGAVAAVPVHDQVLRQIGFRQMHIHNFLEQCTGNGICSVSTAERFLNGHKHVSLARVEQMCGLVDLRVTAIEEVSSDGK